LFIAFIVNVLHSHALYTRCT